MSNEVKTGKKNGSPGGFRSLRSGLALAALVAAAGGALYMFTGRDAGIPPGTTFIAKRGDLDVTVVEGGSIEAMESQEIRSRIKGREGAKILTIVEEGYLVTPEDVANGKVLVELDATDLEDRVVNQEISFQSAEAMYIEKQAQYDIQINQNQSDISAAELTAKFALMEFEKFLGAESVGAILKNLKLDEKGEQLAALKKGGIVKLPKPKPRVTKSETQSGPRESALRQGGGREWGGQGGSWNGAGQEGGRREWGGPSGAGSGPRQGGGMDPERFRMMIEQNGGELPPEMAERMRQMGMDPDDVLKQMGVKPKGDAPIPVDLPDSEPITAEPPLTADPEYVAAREKVDFTKYADAELLEDGQAKQELRQLEQNLLLATEDHRLAKNLLEGQERLAARKFITQNDLDLERVKVEKARVHVESAETEQELYIRYTFLKDAEQLLSDYEEALMHLERTLQETGAKLSQAEAGLKSAERKYNLEAEQLADIEDQIDKCVIRAERPGLVVYGSSTEKNPFRRGNEEPIQEGTTVRERQKIITIPDMTQMGVSVNIHEAAIQRVAKGQKVKMSMDAFPERPLDGEVVGVAVLADSANMFMNPDLKVYPTMVRIEGVHDWLRPGMSAQVEIHVGRLEDVVYIPLQAVSYHGDRQVCYVVKNGVVKRRTVVTGGFTKEFIAIESGLDEGEEVLLAPSDASLLEDLEDDRPREGDAAEAA